MKCATVVRAKRRKDDNADGNVEHCTFHDSAAMIKGFPGEAGEPKIKNGQAFLVILSMALIEKKIIRISPQHFEFLIICSGSEAQLLAWKMAKAQTEESYNQAGESTR